ncbi:uncharacterized protein [Temnothorax longispinosus]|uniref:uncharacterized protein n=1 Tax=Temnothorax longispinosus TaxID=300112 RepID=UPI003A9A6562
MYACNKFNELTVPQRITAVNERKLCRNCLRPNYFAQDWQLSACKNCSAKHNTLLHPSDHTDKVASSEIANTSSVSAGNTRPLHYVIPEVSQADLQQRTLHCYLGILGASVFWELLCIGQIKLGKSLPILQKTHLGWAVSGDVALSDPPSLSICCFSSEAKICNQIEKFWKIEEVDHKTAISSNDEACERHFMETHWQDDTGRFTVSLPFQGDPSELGESRSYALKLFHKLERRLEKNAKLREDYVNFMSECAELNYMSVLKSEQEEPVAIYYISIIIRSLPMKGHLYVITADIIKMYCQVNLQEEQRRLQRILWRLSIDGPILDHLLLTIIYGNAAAAFLDIRSLHQAAYNARKSYPAASQIIIRDFYVDDLLTSRDDLDELRALKEELILLNLEWDESLPIDLHTEWTTYVQKLNAINDISVPRVIICKDPVRIELHGFSDALESVYIPTLSGCHGKADSVTQALTIPLPDRYYWCDSTIVLAWIHGEPHIRKAFVANRLTEIHQLTSLEQWRHVRSEDNPADVISRGIRPSQLKELRLWWHGPQWL